jgi:hypothetical protein
MRTVFLHIGTMKTGTTSLQEFLFNNEEFLRRNGFIYPQAGHLPPNPTIPIEHMGHHRLSLSIQRRRGMIDEGCWGDLLQELARSDADAAIISSETFESCNENQVSKIYDYLNGYDVKIVICLRNQFDYLVSCYKQFVRRHTDRDEEGRRARPRLYHSFRSYLPRGVQQANYAVTLGRWAAHFGKDNIRVIAYDRFKRGNSLYDEFLRVVGVAEEGFTPNYPQVLNPSPTDPAIAAFRLLNWIESTRLGWRLPTPLLVKARVSIEEQNRAGRALSAFASNFIKNEYYTEENLDYVSRAVEEWNEALFADWLGPEDRDCFVVGKRLRVSTHQVPR